MPPLSGYVSQSYLQEVLPRILSLEELWDAAVTEEEEDFCQELAYLLVDTAESYRKLIVVGTPEGIRVVNFMAKILAHEDQEIAKLTLPFWSALQRTAAKRLSRTGEVLDLGAFQEPLTNLLGISS